MSMKRASTNMFVCVYVSVWSHCSYSQK